MRGCADFWNGEPAGRDNQGWGAKLGEVRSHYELGRALNIQYFNVQNNLDRGFAALGFEHIGDVLRGALAEKLAERFLVIGNAVFFDQGDEVGRSVACERGFCEMLVCADEILRAAVNVRKIAAAAAGDEDFLADAIGALEYGNAASAFAGFGGAE